jgi:predicted nucleotidyltransferase
MRGRRRWSREMDHMQTVGWSSPARVIVFGSAATGMATADSGLALLIALYDFADTRRESAVCAKC